MTNDRGRPAWRLGDGPDWRLPTRRRAAAPHWMIGGLSARDLQRARSQNSYLIATSTFADDDPDLGLTLVRENITRVSPDHAMVLAHPDAFRVGPARTDRRPTELREVPAAAAAPVTVDEAAPDAAGGGILSGHFAVFNSWTEIDSWEGRFMEQVAPGAFARTFREGGQRVLMQHGKDPGLGDRILGPIESLSEDAVGAAFSVQLLDGIPDLILAGLRANVYGSSFRFRAARDDFVTAPEPSDWNPRGLPERTVLEAKVFEFGPCAFPAYKDATATLAAA